MSAPRERLAGFGYMTMATLIWGTLPVIIARADAHVAVLVGLRMGIGAVALGAFLVAFGRQDLWPKRHRALLAALAGLLAVHWVLFFRAIQLIGATAVVITFLFPVLVALLAPVVIHEPRERHVLPLAALGFAGTAVIVLSEHGGTGTAGAVLALVTAAIAALLVLGARRAVDAVPGPVIAFWQEGLGFVLLLPWIAAVAPGESVPWAWGTVMGIVHTALAGVLFFRSIGRVPAQEAGVLMYVEPASAVLFVWAFEALAPSVSDAVGGVLVVASGIGIVLLGPRREAVAAPDGGVVAEP